MSLLQTAKRAQKIDVRKLALEIAKSNSGLISDNVRDQLEKGMRYGLIRFGSRVDIYLPKGTEILVSVGDRTDCGETVLGYLK